MALINAGKNLNPYYLQLTLLNLVIMHLSKIAKIETIAANSVPPKIREDYDGWRLRYNYGVTRRANSVLAESLGNIALDEKLAYIESFYKKHSAPARFQITLASQPGNLLKTLLTRGYSKAGGAFVQVAEINLLANQMPKHKVKVFNKLNHNWLEVYEEVEQADKLKTKVRREMLTNINLNAAFSIALVEDKPAAVGLGIYENGYLGLFNIATLANMRKLGAAKAVMIAMAAWAKELGAKEMYLQVANENINAQNAYTKMGFETLYAYDYYTKERDL